MKVELLYFNGCPSYEKLLPRLREMLAEIDGSAQVELRQIASVEDAERERFFGSPTIRVDGRDVDPGADQREDFGLKCRLYRTNEGTSGLPPEEWIRAALAGSKK